MSGVFFRVFGFACLSPEGELARPLKKRSEWPVGARFSLNFSLRVQREIGLGCRGWQSPATFVV